MNFLVKPAIADSESLLEFFAAWNVGAGDLIITNEYVLAPSLAETEPPCAVIYQEKYGMGEPSDEMIDAMLDAAAGKEIKRIIAIGGGTVIDIAKLFVFGDGLSCEEIFAQGAALPCKRELIIIPTTCGTGSEVTNISIVEFKKRKTKVGLAIPALFAQETVLIPGLLATLPYEVFAASSIDALIHAVESYISPKTNPFVRANGRTAIELILTGYQALAQKGGGSLPEDMTDFLYASAMAGIAFGNAGCAAVHALSYPIGGNYHVPHGKANYMLFEQVFVKYQKLGADLSPLETVICKVFDCPPEKVWAELFALLDKILSRPPLREFGVDDAKCAEMAASVVANQQRLLANNPIFLSEEDICAVYKACI